ncbi:MAG TPA: 1,2-phenylacetyl-CoA epoxidase subunit PaaD [Steroidobacteraceae bacterium]|nr:1,2-phenylacetyl-CoA epoxidase subunit PaaD [Steroidobacteraceae bacterium]
MAGTAPGVERVWSVLRGVPDPEIPTIGIVDLGIVRHVQARGGAIEIGLTPTYSGCPATDVIRQLVQEALAAQGIVASIRTVVSPPWTTDWITDTGRRKLAKSGIVPPRRLLGAIRGATDLNDEAIACPHCQSLHTERLSEFGSTPCKSLYRCAGCLEPFERFKCL